MARADDFTSKYLGQGVEREDPSNPDQCMDWAFAWLDELGIDRATIRHLYAYQAFTQASSLTRASFDVVPAGNGYVPPAGGLVIFSQALGVAGHIALVLSGCTASLLRTSDQNWNYKPYIQIVNHQYTNVLGYLVPKLIQGEVMVPDADHLQALFRAFRGRVASPDEVTTYVGKVTYDHMIEALDSGAERVATASALQVGQLAVKDKWDQQIYGLEAQVATLTAAANGSAAGKKLSQIKTIVES